MILLLYCQILVYRCDWVFITFSCGMNSLTQLLQLPNITLFFGIWRRIRASLQGMQRVQSPPDFMKSHRKFSHVSQIQPECFVSTPSRLLLQTSPLFSPDWSSPGFLTSPKYRHTFLPKYRNGFHPHPPQHIYTLNLEKNTINTFQDISLGLEDDLRDYNKEKKKKQVTKRK